MNQWFEQWLAHWLSPWFEVGQFLGLWLLCWSPFAWTVGRYLKWEFPHPPTPVQKIPLVLSLYLLAPPLLWAWLDHRGETFQALGWCWSASFGRHVGLGLGLALLSLLLFWGLEWAMGWIQISVEPARLFRQLGPILIVAMLISAVEELLFRGFVATRFLSGTGAEMAAGSVMFSLTVLSGIGLTNLLFALLHLPWERWQAVTPQLPGLWLLGVVLSIASIRWGDLGVAVGLHGGWVWAIATIDGMDGLKPTGKVPAWVTGLGGSLLAGAGGIMFLALMGGGMIVLPRVLLKI